MSRQERRALDFFACIIALIERGPRYLLKKLEPIAKRIINIKAAYPLLRASIIIHNGNFILLQMLTQSLQAANRECRMSFSSGYEVLLHANMHLMHATLKPNSASLP